MAQSPLQETRAGEKFSAGADYNTHTYNTHTHTHIHICTHKVRERHRREDILGEAGTQCDLLGNIRGLW